MSKSRKYRFGYKANGWQSWDSKVGVYRWIWRSKK